MKGKINFDLYPFQEDTLRQLRDNRFNIILKSRQMGISTLSGGFALHSMLFNDEYKILVIATKQEVAKNLIEKVQMMYEFLPNFLKAGIKIENNNKLQLVLSNGSSIKAVSSSPNAGRSEGLSLLLMDECFFSDTTVCIRNSYGEEETIEISKLFNKLENETKNNLSDLP